MSTKITHGTTTACDECCDTLLKTAAGTRRHQFLMLTAEIALSDKSAASPRTVAWGKVYRGKFNPGTAGRRLGLIKPRKEESQEAWQAAHDSYVCHQRPVTQVIVDRQEEVSLELLDIVQGIARADIADFFHLGEEDEDGEPDPILTKIIRMLFLGVQRKKAVATENHELFGSGVFHDYKREYSPPTREQIGGLCRRYGGERMLPMRELKARGLSQHISGYQVDRYGARFIIDFKESWKVWAGITGQFSTTLNMNDAQAAQEQVEVAFIKICRLVVPDLVDAIVAGVAWELGEPVKLGPDQDETVKRDGDRLVWRGDGWAVEGRLRLVEKVS